MRETQYEIAPGIVYEVKNNKQSLFLEDSQGRRIYWDFEEITSDPSAWLESLKAVALACKYGPSAARNQIQLEKERALLPVGMIMCNVCSSLFGVDPEELYRFHAEINGKTQLDFQCSEECHEQRKRQAHRSQFGEKLHSIISQLPFKKPQS